MKKILSVLLIAMTILLASCGSKDKDVTNVTDNPAQATAESLNLVDPSTGKQLKAAGEDNSYYIITIQNDAKASLFAHNTALDATIETNKKLMKTINVTPLVFTNSISEAHKTAIMKEVFNSEYGITKEMLGVDFDLMVNKKWTSELNCEDVVKAYLDNNQKDNYFSKIYLPIHVKHYTKNNDENSVDLDVNVLIPVYYAFTTISNSNNSDSTFNNIPVKDLTFDENYILK